MPITNTSSSPAAEERLLRVPLARLHPHPANPNVMEAGQLELLERHIGREGRYPPLLARPHPELPGHYQLLDGEQRRGVLARLGHEHALCYIWPCDDATALLLLATINRLRGDDLPVERAALLTELDALMPRDLLASLLPEDATQLERTLELVDLDPERLLAELTAAASREAPDSPRTISFAVAREDEPVIESAVERAATELSGRNRRGRALVRICTRYLEASDA